MYSPKSPKKINTIPKQKKMAIINVGIPGENEFFEKEKKAINCNIIAAKQNIEINNPNNIIKRNGAMEVVTIPFIAWS